MSIINWSTLLNFVCNDTMQYMSISSTRVRVGMVLYDTNAHIIWRLTQYNTSSDVSAACNSMTFIGGSTNLQEALAMSLTLFQESLRPLCETVIVVITDGRSNDAVSSTNQANVIKSAGIKIVAVAVVPTTDSPGYKELQKVSTDEASLLWVPDYPSLRWKLSDILYSTCGVFQDFGRPTYKAITFTSGSVSYKSYWFRSYVTWTSVRDCSQSRFVSRGVTPLKDVNLRTRES